MCVNHFFTSLSLLLHLRERGGLAQQTDIRNTREEKLETSYGKKKTYIHTYNTHTHAHTHTHAPGCTVDDQGLAETELVVRHSAPAHQRVGGIRTGEKERSIRGT